MLWRYTNNVYNRPVLSAGLPQADIIVNNQVCTLLTKHGYEQYTHTHMDGLFKHHIHSSGWNINVKYTKDNSLQYLMSAMQEMYTATIDTFSTLYYGLTMKWDYDMKHVDALMPGYINRALQ